MNLSKEVQEKINILFENNEEIRGKLLEGDTETIRQIGLESQKGMNPEDIVDAYESNDDKIMEYLYKKAKKLVELQRLYKDLCLEYSKENRSDNEGR